MPETRRRPRGQSRPRRTGAGEPRHTRGAQHREARRAALPAPSAITFPSDLPVSERREEISEAIRDHQVVIVAGETGSGKTTQLPKICLQLGRGVDGLIGHTQPRRIAARSVAERLSHELDSPLGALVGYQVRFTDESRADTLIKVMTDGILLNELQHDRMLSRYDTLIIDEAHERSLNIDFILGYLRQLLPQRPDLKVIITSATIDVQRFAAHFADAQGRPAPIIEVSGRTYPVEIRYRPLVREGPPTKQGQATEVEVDQVTGICEAVEELWTEGSGRDGAGEDILVFCSGEREIRDAADALEGMKLPGTQVLPLYGRLSAAEQHRVFGRHGGRRIVVSTNVAETSLTVPGIRYVIDTGTARISRYSQRLKVQRLPIEPISQASANQRSGRCGRLADGIAIRLYAEEDYLARPEFTDPEILRTNLASVILAMTNLGLGQIEKFPFLEPPDSRQVADGVRLLTELQAIDPDAPAHLPRKRITPYGRAIVALPVDPRLARMLVEAERHSALKEVLVIVAALSIQDVRERPADNQARADQLHARFRHAGGVPADTQRGTTGSGKTDKAGKGAKGDLVDSDFLVLLNLWRYLQKQQKALSGSAFRRLCKAEYLHYLRVREWQDLHTQLKKAARNLGLELNENPATPDQVHESLLSGLLSHVGLYEREKRDYLGARNAHFVIQPGSVLHRRNPDWVMTAQLVETSRLWARTNAAIDPAWVERAAAHLVKRSYAEPRWSRSAGGAVADERVTLYGIPLVAGRPVPLGRIDPETARDLFIRTALVEGDWDTRHEFFHANRRLVRELGQLEERARRRDILVDDDTLVEFYDQRIPAEVVSGTHFDTWWKQARREDPSLLTFTEDLLIADDASAVSQDDFPTSWTQGELTFGLTYQFEPGSDADGVTVHLPVEVLNQVQEDGFDWLVPGVREELVTALIKALPKDIRRNFVPAPDHARAALAGMESSGAVGTLPVREALAEELTRRGLARVRASDVEWARVPDHLKMTFRVERATKRGRGEVLGEGKDLAELKAALAGQVRTTMAAAASGVERAGLTSWPPDLDPLPHHFSRRVGSRVVQGYPALVDTGGAVDVRVLATRSEADRETRRGIRRLLLLNTSPPWKRLLALLTNAQKLSLGHNPHGSVPALLEDALAAAVDSVVAALPGATVRTPSEFERALVAVRQQSVPRVLEIVEALVPILDTARQVSLRLQRLTAPAAADLASDLRRQLDQLVRPGFVTEVGWARLPRMVVWLRGMAERLDKGVQDLPRDRQRLAEVQVVEEELATFLSTLPPHRRHDPDVLDVVWALQELRVSTFAQRLGTSGPVSAKRIYAAMDAAEDASG